MAVSTPIRAMRYSPHPGAYPGFRALCPESGVLFGVCNGYISVFGVYLLLAVMVDYLDNLAVLDPAPAGTRDVALRRLRVPLWAFAVILWTVAAGLRWIADPSLIAKAVVWHHALQASDG